MHQYLDSIFNNPEIENAIHYAFKFNYNKCRLYRDYCDSVNKNYFNNNKINNIPFLPIGFFKNHRVQSNKKTEYKIFLSSGTTGKKSKHYVTDLKIYNHSLLNSFKYAFGDPKKFHFIGITPSLKERKNSSLIYMINKLQNYSKNDGFFSSNLEEFKFKIKEYQKSKSKTIIFGLSHLLLEFIENEKFKLNNCVVIETGGMKGNREEIEKKKLHEILSYGYGTDKIFSEYGMTELLSQSYSIKDNVFSPPPWKKVLIRDFNDPLRVQKTGRGIINIIDLANINSCCFISTEDIGEVFKDGSFKLYGRANESDIRGCNNMLVDIN